MEEHNYTKDEILNAICHAKLSITNDEVRIGFELLAMEIFDVTQDKLYEIIEEYEDTHVLDYEY